MQITVGKSGYGLYTLLHLEFIAGRFIGPEVVNLEPRSGLERNPFDVMLHQHGVRFLPYRNEDCRFKDIDYRHMLLS